MPLNEHKFNQKHLQLYHFFAKLLYSIIVRLCSMELDNFGHEWWCVCCKISMHLMHNAADDVNGKGIMSPEYSLSLTWHELSASST